MFDFSGSSPVGPTCGVVPFRPCQPTSNAANNGFTVGIRALGQTYSQCLAANTGNYSIAGAFNIQNEARKFLGGNDVAVPSLGDASEGQAGLMLAEGGSRSVAAGVGTSVSQARGNRLCVSP